MDNRKDVHDFLVSRRAQVTPAQAGLPTYDVKRRVPGLRREEVARPGPVGVIHPGKVFDLTLPLSEVAEAYAAMDERRAIKTMLMP